ncbi:YncE family protein [Pararobbsia alpina]|uniref:YncE family protein n=1 Tax=Pararobbsia alpina TaxID=621374 RepID=UPI0039A748BB
MTIRKSLALASCIWLGATAMAQAADSHASTFAVEAHFQLPGTERWDYVGFDAVRHHLFVSRDTYVQVVDTESGHRVGQIANMSGVHGFAFAQNHKLGFVTNGRGNTIAVVDLDTLKTVDTIQAGGADPDGILYVPDSDRIWVSNGHAHSVSVVDPVSRHIEATIDVGGKPETIAADRDGHVFVNIEDKNEIVEIDAKHSTVMAHWTLAPCEEPSGLAIDADSKRLFATCSNQRMAVVDATTGHVVAQLPIGDHPDAAAFDPVLKVALSSNGDSSTLTVIHEDDPDHFSVSQNVRTRSGAKTMALDETHHRVYLVSARFGPAPKATTQKPNPHPTIVPGSVEVVVVAPPA